MTVFGDRLRGRNGRVEKFSVNLRVSLTDTWSKLISTKTIIGLKLAGDEAINKTVVLCTLAYMLIKRFTLHNPPESTWQRQT